MFNGKYTTISRVIENIIRDTGFTDEINFIDAVEWAYRAMEFIGAPQPYITKVTDGNEELGHLPPLEVENFRAELPCDVHKIIQVREWCNRQSMTTSSYTFELSTNLKEVGGADKLQYTINDNYIFTNFKTGQLEIAYLAFPIDSEGYPAIPDDERYLRAVEAYITNKIAFKLWLQDKISDAKYKAIELKWLFFVKSAKSRMQMPSMDEMEGLKNQIVRLFQHPDRHRHQFVQLNDEHQQRIRLDRFGRAL